MVAVCEWSCPMVRSAAAPVAPPLHGADVLETETITGVAAQLRDEGDPCSLTVISDRDQQ